MKGIREVTDLTGVTESALRYYNEKGILKPSVREETGRKKWLYSDEDIRRLKLIMLYRKLDIGIREIALILSDTEEKSRVLDMRLNELCMEKEEIESQIYLIRVLKALDKLKGNEEAVMLLMEQEEFK